jgi:hypothetical protein
MDSSSTVVIGVGSFSCSCITVIIFVIAYLWMSTQNNGTSNDKLEAVLIKLTGKKETFTSELQNSSDVFKYSNATPLPLSIKLSKFNKMQQDSYNEFMSFVPANYKNKIICNDPTGNSIVCLFITMARDKAVDDDTLSALWLCLLLIQSAGTNMLSYDKSKRELTTDVPLLILMNSQNKTMSYNNFKEITQRILHNMAEAIQKYNSTCTCDAPTTVTI